MTVVTGSRRSLLGSVVALVASRAHARGRGSRLAAVLLRVRENVGTLMAAAAFDTGAFLGGRIAGFVVLGVCILAVDWAFQG